MSSVYTHQLSDLFVFCLIAARLGGLLFFIPGFAELPIPTHFKALFVLTLSLVFTPLLDGRFPPWPSSSFSFFLLIISEILIGYLSALTVKLIFSALDVAGSMIGYQIGLANAFASSPASAQQSALPSVFLTLIATVFALSLNLHHAVIQSFLESYETFQPGDTFLLIQSMGDALNMVTSLVKTSFDLGLQMASPVIVTSLFLFAAAGLVNRLIPQVQVFFVTQPLQILLGLGVLFLTLPKMMDVFAQTLWRTMSP